MKLIGRLSALALIVGILIAFAIAYAASSTRAEDVVLGMDLKPVLRYTPEQQQQLLEDLHAAHVPAIRTWVANDSSYDFIRSANALGIKIELTVPIVFRTEATKRAAVKDAPTMYPSFPLSAADPVQTAAGFDTQLARLEEMGITFVAFEVGNEQNNASFNGDFAIHDLQEPGTRKNMSVDDLKHDPEGQVIAAGYKQYVKVLAALKEVRDRSKLNRRTPLLLGGLADTGDETVWPRARVSAASIGGSIRLLREYGLDQIVDAYGIHTYPWTNGPGQPGPSANRKARLEKYALSECRPAGQGKPCWVTEWGFQNKDLTSCPSNESDRSILVRELMSDFRPYVQQGRVVGLLYYVWGRDAWAKQEDPYAVFRCGTLTQSGHLALDPSLLR